MTFKKVIFTLKMSVIPNFSSHIYHQSSIHEQETEGKQVQVFF